MKINKSIIMAGFEKSGSTTLFDTLVKHSKVSKPKQKEPHIFYYPEAQVKKNWEWYLNNYPEQKEWLIDASMFYIYEKGAINLIKKYIQEPKVIIIIRDPAKRAYSGYLERVKKIPRAETREFNQILSEVKGPETSKVKATEEKSIKKAIKNKEINDECMKEKYLSKVRLPQKATHAKGFDEKYRFKMHYEGFRYFQNSEYSHYIKAYEKAFKKVKIVFFEELIKNPERIIKEVLKFLGLKPEKLTLQKSNITVIPNKWGKRILEFSKKYLPYKFLIKVIKKTRLPIKKLLFGSKQRMSKEQYDQARKILAKEYEYWFKKKPGLKELWKY